MEITCKICSCRLSNLDTHKIRLPLDGYVYRICNTCAEHLKRFTAYEFINTGQGSRIERRYEESNEPVDVQPVKHGSWVSRGDDWWMCSCCRKNIIFSTSEYDRTTKQRYCCRCGARMDGDENENNS